MQANRSRNIKPNPKLFKRQSSLGTEASQLGFIATAARSELVILMSMLLLSVAVCLCACVSTSYELSGNDLLCQEWCTCHQMAVAGLFCCSCCVRALGEMSSSVKICTIHADLSWQGSKSIFHKSRCTRTRCFVVSWPHRMLHVASCLWCRSMNR